MRKAATLREQARAGERGVALGLAMVLLVVLLLAAGIAVWGLRSETGSAGGDRMTRQLFDCAERALAFGKVYFSNTNFAINDFLSTNVCGVLPCYPTVSTGPFRPQTSIPPPCGTPIPGYPDGTMADSTQLKQLVNVGGQQMEFIVAIYDDADESAMPQNYACDTNNRVIVWARCRDVVTNQSRTASALVQLTGTPSSDYSGQAGRGFRNLGNAN
ncbi:MAG TPA: hypothetical protein VKN99_10925 [Polyangia bacterium]|nr:hypothetical protein [Polyangia bacterium]